MSEHKKLVVRLLTTAFEEGMLEAQEHVSYSKANKKAHDATEKAQQELLTYIEYLQASIPPRSQFS